MSPIKPDRVSPRNPVRARSPPAGRAGADGERSGNPRSDRPGCVLSHQGERRDWASGAHAVQAHCVLPPARRYLSQVRVASPCSESWDNMTGSEQVRFCGRCEKRVYNLSAMSADEAEALLARKRFGVCIQYARRADGTLVTTDCPVGAKRSRRTSALAVASLLLTAAGCTSQNQEEAVAGRTNVAPAEPPSPAKQPEPPRESPEEAARRLDEYAMQKGGMPTHRVFKPECPPRWKLNKAGKKIRVKGSANSEVDCAPPDKQPASHDRCDPKDPLCGL